MQADSVSRAPTGSPETGNSEPSRRDCLRAILRMSEMRPTQQRLDLADRLVGRDRHVTAEQLHNEVVTAGHAMSLATVYNTLRQFQNSGLVHELSLEGVRSVFDTNTSRHHHFYFTDDGRTIDIPARNLVMTELLGVPDGYEIGRVEVVVRLRRKAG